MNVKLLQTNLNHARQTQNLFCNTLRERGIGLAIVAEPHIIPENNPNWVGSTCGTVAIVRESTQHPPFSN